MPVRRVGEWLQNRERRDRILDSTGNRQFRAERPVWIQSLPLPVLQRALFKHGCPEFRADCKLNQHHKLGRTPARQTGLEAGR